MIRTIDDFTKDELEQIIKAVDNRLDRLGLGDDLIGTTYRVQQVRVKAEARLKAIESGPETTISTVTVTEDEFRRLLNEREHLRQQVTDLQHVNSAYLQRARSAEALVVALGGPDPFGSKD